MPILTVLSVRFLRRQISKLSTIAALGILSATFIGCGGGETSYAPPVAVSGKVSLKGQPLTGGTIHFVPADAKKALPGSGEIQSDSSFKITTSKPDDGLTPGKYTVFFDPPVASDGSKKDSPIIFPEVYLAPGTSDITQTIDKPTSTMQIILK